MARLRTVRDLGALARAARLERGWTQQEAADAAGVSRRFVNMLESGEHANAEVGRALALLQALDVDLDAATREHRSTSVPAVAAEPPHRTDEIDLDAYLSTFRREGPTR